MIYIFLTENLTEKIRPKNTAKTFQTKFLKILDSYDFLWTNVSVGGRDLVSLLVTFLSNGKRQILDIAKSGFRIKVSNGSVIGWEPIWKPVLWIANWQLSHWSPCFPMPQIKSVQWAQNVGCFQSFLPEHRIRVFKKSFFWKNFLFIRFVTPETPRTPNIGRF